MNKSEFLNELEKRIRVLEKNEIKDILAEYSQHIDMRIGSGLSETEAIKDFGSIDELTAEILEAYHVNPEYERGTEITESIKKENKDTEKRKALFISAIVAMWNWIKKIFYVAAKGVKKLFEKVKKLNGKIYGAFKKEKNEAEYIDKVQVIESKAKTKRKANKSKNVFKKAEKRCRGVFKKVVYACLVIIVVLCLLPVAFVGIASIFAGGLSIVFLLQGYPVIGIFIVLLGLTVSSIALGGLLISLIAKNKKEKLEICETEEADEIDETDEVCEGDESK